MSHNNSYDYEYWPGELLNVWREMRAHLPDNMTIPDYELIEDLSPGGVGGGGHYPQEGLSARQITEQEARALRVANVLRLYYTPAMAILGALSSLLALPILSRVSRSTRSSHIPYYFGICVVTVLFLAGLTLIWLGSVGVHVYTIPGTCQFTAFISQASHFLYTWIMVALVTDRLANQLRSLKVCPSWLALMASPTRARILIFILSALALAVFFNLSMMEGTVHFGAVRICVVIMDYLRISLLLDKIDAVLNFFIPFLAIVLMDVAIILNHCRLKLRRSVPSEPEGATSMAADSVLAPGVLRPSPAPSTDTTGTDAVPTATVLTPQGQLPASDTSANMATVVVSGLYIILSLPNVIQRTISTFTDYQLLFTMTAKGILYQHTFASLFHTTFVINVIMIVSLDSEVRYRTKMTLHHIFTCCKRPCSRGSEPNAAPEMENMDCVGDALEGKTSSRGDETVV